MSTAEDQPAVGTPEFHQTRPPSVYTSGALEFTRTHVWTDHQGITQGNIALGAVDITFHNPQQVRDLIARLAGLAGEMDADIARQRPDSDQQPDPYIDAIAAEHVQEYEPEPCDGGCASVLGTGPCDCGPEPCSKCGATDTPLVDGKCFNTGACGRRQQKAARDAEAAQVTR